MKYAAVLLVLLLGLGYWTLGRQFMEVVSAQGPEFRHDLTSVLPEAYKENKPIVLVFSASWCGPCQQMKKSVYPSMAVKPYWDRFLWVYLDVDASANRPLVEKYGIQAIPSIYILRPGGSTLASNVGGMDPDSFANWIRPYASPLTR